MAWIVLVVSGLLEAVWATALDRSDGFSRIGPTVVFGVALVLSMGGLGWSLRELPVGTAYAVWVGIGAVTTVSFAMVTGAESVSVLKAVLLVGLVGCIAGLKIVEG
ncbi:DMT family transporter [Nocardioides sp. AX2bis]|uniref:DMT family transporter n=1 Tax=Nocardioides sp. AX2bis TaxID=2653157 RepID=UPI0012F134F1|nr:SMR family transporter [Nocardioides sp. AX2bis]VXB42854.1 Guanidinium exporter [Nocardioides sp. AX2bis]